MTSMPSRRAILLMLGYPAVGLVIRSHALVDAASKTWYSAAIKWDLPKPRSPITTTGRP